MAPGDGTREYSYSFATSGLTATSSATDVLAIGGKTGKKTFVKYLQITGITTGTGPTIDVLLFKRTAADTTGHEVDIPLIAHDSAFPAATATVTAYTTNPTLGASTGIVGASRVTFSTTAVTFTPNQVVFDWTGDVHPITLNTSEEQLCVNLNGATIAGGLLRYYGQITEKTA